MNYLKAGLRVKLGLTNPYEIKNEFKIFKQPANNTIKAKFLGKNQLNSDHYVFRFELPEENKCLGLKIGQYIWIEIDGENRPYVPISSIDEPNYIDLLVRDMRTTNKSSFTSKILNLEPQTEVSVIGPGTQFIYNGFGKFTYFSPETKGETQKTFKNIGIITHCSAITTSYSLIESIAMNYDNRTGVSLLWLGDKEEDFIFINEFAQYVEQCKLSMNLMMTGFQKGWLGPYGKLMESHVEDFMPPPQSNSMILMSGLEGELAHIPGLIKNMGYKDYMSF